MPLISLDNVYFSYDKQKDALCGVSLAVEKGEYVCIVGHNGSGKSTLSKLLNGLLIPDKGNVVIDGFDSQDKKSLFEIRKRVGVVFQNPDNQLVASIVEDDVAFGPENLGVLREEIAKRIDFALSAVGMEEYRKSSPTHLSGGQKQRVAIAGVLALLPKVIVLDESTAMLDPEGRKEVLKTVKDLNEKQGVTVIAITHYMEETVNADRVIVLKGGKIAETGTPREIFSNPERLTELGLELPPAAMLAKRLRDGGLNIRKDVLTPQELAEELCALKVKP